MNIYAAAPPTPNDQSPSKRKDLSNLLGLNDQGPGTPSRQVAQMVALQNLPNVAPEIAALSSSKKDLNHFLGIEQSRRARPQSLAMGGDGSPSSARQMKLNQLKALNKTLSRFTSSSTMAAQSAPTTPDCYPDSILHCDENLSPLKKKNLHKFLGLPPPPPPIPPPRTASSTKRRVSQDPTPSMLKMTSALSSSTPDDLEKENDAVVDELRRISQSNDGLATPGSCTTPAKGNAVTPQLLCGTVVPVVGPKQSNSMFSLATAAATNSLPRAQFQPAIPAAYIRPNQFSGSLQRGVTLLHGHNNMNLVQRHPPPQPLNLQQSRTLPRSNTLDDVEPMAVVDWVHRSSSSGVQRHSSLLQPKSILKDSQNNLARRSQSSASSAYFKPCPAPQWPLPPHSCSCRAGTHARQPLFDPIYVTMGPNPNRQQDRHSIGFGYVPPTMLTLNHPRTKKATTTVLVNGDDYLDMSDVRVKTTAIVHNEPAMFCANMRHQKTVVQIRGEGEGADAVSRVESELEETI